MAVTNPTRNFKLNPNQAIPLITKEEKELKKKFLCFYFQTTSPYTILWLQITS